MRFCRSCYAIIAADEAVCHACGAEWQEHGSTDEIVSKGPEPPVASLIAPKYELKKDHAPSESPRASEAPRQASKPAKTHKIEYGKIYPTVMLAVVVAIASYLLGQHAIHTEVKTYFLDDKYYGLVLTQLHAQPFAYYSIAVDLYHQLYAPTLAVIHFPLIFYIWLLAPNVQDVKWLYLPFAIAASTASYFTIAAVTKRRLLAALSAVWIAHFLETNIYLMFEYWGIPVFLIGLAFFVSERHAPAAATIALATLIKEVFAPFMLITSIYYVPQFLVIFLNRKKYGAATLLSLEKRKAQMLTRKAAVWCTATIIVGVAYYLNGLASGGAASPVFFFRTFDPSILPRLFAGGWFDYPPLPIIVVVGLALIGMSALVSWNQRIVIYTSFASMILLMLTAGGEGLISSWQEIVQSSPRYIAMSITLVNVFWLVGLYKIARYVRQRFWHAE